MFNDEELNDRQLQEVKGGSNEKNPAIVKGKIVSYCGYLQFKVELLNGHIISCKVASELRLKPISLIVGDTVGVIVNQDDLSKGTIVEI